MKAKSYTNRSKTKKISLSAAHLAPNPPGATWRKTYLAPPGESPTWRHRGCHLANHSPGGPPGEDLTWRHLAKGLPGAHLAYSPPGETSKIVFILKGAGNANPLSDKECVVPGGWSGEKCQVDKLPGGPGDVCHLALSNPPTWHLASAWSGGLQVASLVYKS